MSWSILNKKNRTCKSDPQLSTKIKIESDLKVGIGG